MHRSPYQGISVSSRSIGLTWQGMISARGLESCWQTDRVYLKQYQKRYESAFDCVVDASESMGMARSSHNVVVEQIRSCDRDAASLSYMAIQQQDSVGSRFSTMSVKRYFKRAIRRGSGKSSRMNAGRAAAEEDQHWGRCLDQLAEKLTHRSLDRAAVGFL
jgi:hypothetical protein